jgi:hypothetical protein
MKLISSMILIKISRESVAHGFLDKSQVGLARSHGDLVGIYGLRYHGFDIELMGSVPAWSCTISR